MAMKIIPSITIHTSQGMTPPGGIVEVPDDDARRLIAEDLAIPAPKDPPRKKGSDGAGSDAAGDGGGGAQ
jgi:hypothetical protein